jgi:hypothetical protein
MVLGEERKRIAERRERIGSVTECKRKREY